MIGILWLFLQSAASHLLYLALRLETGSFPKPLSAKEEQAAFAAMRARGVEFLEEPRHEAYATVAVFEDLYGNRWDLLQPK